MAKTAPVIGIFTTIQGHHSIAEAIQSTLQTSYETHVFDEVDGVFDYYMWFYRHYPALFIAPFLFSSNMQFIKLLSQIIKKKYLAVLEAFITEHQITYFINTFWMYQPALEAISKQYHIPFLNVIPDPRSFHPTAVAQPPALNLTFDDQASTRCHSLYPQSLTDAVGWFVRPQFEAKYVKAAVKQQLDLKNELVFLLTSGSEGTEKILELLKKLNPKRPLQVVVACGSNTALMSKINHLKPSFSPHLDLTLLPFTNKLHLYYQAADLIIGKAGPNSVFEACAVHTPFFATTHIAGQEDGNLEIITQHQVGYVEENATKATQLLEEIANNPDQLHQFQPAIRQLAEYNQQAKTKLLAHIHSTWYEA